MKVWRQFIVVRDDSLRLLSSVSNITSAMSDPNNMLILRGHGPWYPAMRGLSWGATCGERHPDEALLSDMTPLLQVLLDSTPIPISDAPSADVQAWLQTLQGAA
jgi:hypothetical protein